MCIGVCVCVCHVCPLQQSIVPSAGACPLSFAVAQTAARLSLAPPLHHNHHNHPPPPHLQDTTPLQSHIRPLSVAGVFRAAFRAETQTFALDGHELSLVKLVGVIHGTVQTSTFYAARLRDHTGSLKICQFLDGAHAAAAPRPAYVDRGSRCRPDCTRCKAQPHGRPPLVPVPQRCRDGPGLRDSHQGPQ